MGGSGSPLVEIIGEDDGSVPMMCYLWLLVELWVGIGAQGAVAVGDLMFNGDDDGG